MLDITSSLILSIEDLSCSATCSPQFFTRWNLSAICFALGRAAVHDKQALVLVNKGGATGADVKRLADTIIADVKQKFGITLSTEVNYI